MSVHPPTSTLFPYTTLFRSNSVPHRPLPLLPSRSRFSRRYRMSHSPLNRLRLRSEEHTSELQSLTNLVCRLLLEKKKKIKHVEKAKSATCKYGTDLQCTSTL